MKKRITGAVLCLLFVLLTLTATTPGHFYYDAEELRVQVVAIELIDYNNPEPRTFGGGCVLVTQHQFFPAFDFERMELIETMPEENFEDFFAELSRDWVLTGEFFGCTSERQRAPEGRSIIMHYENGEFEVLSERFIGRCRECGRFIEYLGRLEGGTLRALINLFET